MRLTPARWAKQARSIASTTASTTSVRRPQGIPPQQLSQWFRDSSGHDGKRRDIINPDLCVEALDLVRPALPPPGTCDVIDLNPGASVWTQALHNVLQPRRHVLVELEQQVYSHAIDPLLNAANSTYRRADNIVEALDLNNDLLSPEFRHFHQNLTGPEKEATRKSPTTQLIITANLVGRLIEANAFRGELSKLFMEYFRRSVAFDSDGVNFNQYGLVKLLVWVSEADKYSLVPRCASFRWRLGTHLEAACNVREIVSSFMNDSRSLIQTTWHGAALEGMREVHEKQAKSGITIPEYRRQPPPEPASNCIDPVPENFKQLLALKKKPRLVKEFLDMWRVVEQRHPQWMQEYLVGPKLPRSVYPEVEKLRLLVNRMVTTHNQYEKVDSLVREQIALEKELLHVRRESPNDTSAYMALVERLQPEFDRIKAHHAKMFKDNYHHFLKALDDYRVLLPKPHILSWNNREFEPLLCHPKDDFYPHQPMTLLEITPNPSFAQRIDTGDRQIIFDYIVNDLANVRNVTVQEALENLLGSAASEQYNDFVASLPGLTDPLLGGHHDLTNVRVRTLSTETLIDIALQYEKWPFRKPLQAMLEASFGSRGK